MTKQVLNRWTLLAFALPSIMQGFMHAPAQSLVQGIYAKYLGLPLAALGAAVLATRIFDALTDPAIGMLADAWKRRGGSYKQFVAVGTVITIVGLWQLYRPTADAGIAYFTGWFMLAYLGWTITEIPYRAWSMVLSAEYVWRTRIQAWLGLGATFGTFSFYLVPFVGKSLGITNSTEVDLTTLRLAAVAIAVAVPLLNLIAIWRVPEESESAGGTPLKVREYWSAITSNPPFVYFLLMFLAYGITNGMSQGVVFLFLDSYLGLGKQLAGILLVAAPITLLGIVMWSVVCQKYERQKVWAISTVVSSIGYLGFGFLQPGESAAGPFVVIFSIVMLFATCAFVAAPAMIGDVVDFGKWKLGHDHGGFYLSFYALVTKSVAGIGIALGLFLLDIFGFDAKAVTQADSGEFAIKLTAAWIPGIGIGLAAPFIWRFPLDRKKHQEILAHLSRQRQDG